MVPVEQLSVLGGTNQGENRYTKAARQRAEESTAPR